MRPSQAHSSGSRQGYDAAIVTGNRSWLSSSTLIVWLSLAAASVQFGYGSAGPVATPTTSPATAAASIGLPPVHGATLVPNTITGMSAAQLRVALDRLGPTDHGVHVDAFTRWYLSWQWPTASDGTFILSGATVTSTITITAPEWTPPPGVDTYLVAEWRNT